MTQHQDDVQINAWSARIPICLQLAPHEITSPTPVSPLYFLAPRHGYLSSLANQAWPCIQHVLPSSPGHTTHRPWTDMQGLPLKSFLPTGVLFDLLAEDVCAAMATAGGLGAAPPRPAPTAATSPHQGPPSPGPSTNLELEALAQSLPFVPAPMPWLLTLHYTNPSEEVAPSWMNEGALQVQAGQAPPRYLHALKEACFMCGGSAGSQKVMMMHGPDQDKLWRAAETGELATVRATLAKLGVVPASRLGSLPSIPTRVLVRPADAGHAGGGLTWDALPCTSRPFPAHDAAGAWVTLGQALRALLPQLFPEDCGGGGGVCGEGMRGSGGQPAPPPAPVPPCPSPPPPTPPASGQEEQGSSLGEGCEVAEHAQTGGESEGAAGGLGEGGSEVLGGTACSSKGSEQSEKNQKCDQGEKSGSPQGSAGDNEGHLSPPSLSASAASIATAATEGEGAGSGVQEAPAGVRLLPGGRLTLPMLLPPAFPQPALQGTSSGGLGKRRVLPRVLVGGIEPPLDTPIAWLHARMHDADYFLYIVVRCR